MQKFITDIKVNYVRNLNERNISVSETHLKHLVMTGKNGSGKSSLLDALAKAVHASVYENTSNINNNNIVVNYNVPTKDLSDNHFITAYYKAERDFHSELTRSTEYTGQKFEKYLLDKKMGQVLAKMNGKDEKAGKITEWFDEFDKLLKKIFDDHTARLTFDEDTLHFSIQIENRLSFDFMTLSSGYAAIMYIIVNLILEMDKVLDANFDLSMPGIVFIDEIEAHLHLDMQRKILPLLIKLFPNVQFIVSTNSPFVVNSIENAVIYDLDSEILVADGLCNIPYAGIVNGYFNVNEMSQVLQRKYERYCILANKESLTDDDYDEISELELYLNKIPDFLALNITAEYNRLKKKLH